MEIRSVVVISLLESIHCPCSAKNFVREEFNPKLVNRFKLPITDTNANTPYCSVPNLLIKIGIQRKVSIALIMS